MQTRMGCWMRFQYVKEKGEAEGDKMMMEFVMQKLYVFFKMTCKYVTEQCKKISTEAVNKVVL